MLFLVCGLDFKTPTSTMCKSNQIFASILVGFFFFCNCNSTPVQLFVRIRIHRPCITSLLFGKVASVLLIRTLLSWWKRNHSSGIFLPVKWTWNCRTVESCVQRVVPSSEDYLQRNFPWLQNLGWYDADSSRLPVIQSASRAVSGANLPLHHSNVMHMIVLASFFPL